MAIEMFHTNKILRFYKACKTQVATFAFEKFIHKEMDNKVFENRTGSNRLLAGHEYLNNNA
jgi:hypothetical protein